MAVCIKSTPSAAQDCLRKGLDSPDENIRRQSLRALSMFKESLDNELLERVLKLMNDPAVSSTAYFTANELFSHSPILRNSVSPAAKQSLTLPKTKSASPIKKRNFWNSLKFMPNWIEREIDETSSTQDKIKTIEDVEIFIKQAGYAKILHDLIKFLYHVMQESNSTVVYRSLQMLESLLRNVGITRSADFTKIIQSVIIKLGDNRINIRFIAGKIMQAFLKELGADKILNYLLEKINDVNWHIREEVLYLFIYAVQVRNHKFYYDFVNLVLPVCKLLNDTKSKIRFVALETLKVLADECGFNEVCDKAKQVLDEISYDRLKERLRNKDIASVRADGTIELPKALPSSAPIAISGKGFDTIITAEEGIEEKKIGLGFDQKIGGISKLRGSSARLGRRRFITEPKPQGESMSPKNIPKSHTLLQETPSILKAFTLDEKQPKTPKKLVRSISEANTTSRVFEVSHIRRKRP
jgi:hypothetical protein